MNRKEIIRQVIEAVYALGIAVSIGRWSFHIAYVQRGYKSVGGEYLLIPVVYWLAYKAIHYLFDNLEELDHERSCKKGRSRGTVGIQNH